MTVDDFLAFYPQFDGLFPDAVMTAYVASANARFDDFAEDAEEARRLLTAHRLTLYAKTFPASIQAKGGVSSFSALASAGEGGRITSKKVDDVAITYASGASSSSAATSLAELSETMYGLQLLTLLRLHSCPRYVP